jgi:hypothetical protein
MSMLDELTAQRQRLTERLARMDAERTKLADQLAELDAAERVLARLNPTKAKAPRRGRRARTTNGNGSATAAPSRRARLALGLRKAAARGTIPLGEATLRAVKALGREVSAEQIRGYLGKQFGMQVRANHLGRALQRHRVGGRLNERDRRWSIGQLPGEAPAS